MRKNGIPRKKVKVITKKDIRPDDIVIGYRNISLSDMEQINAFKAVCMLHFHGEKSDSERIQKANPNILINESDLGKCSEIFQRYYGWYKGKFLVHPFVAASRFNRIKPFVKQFFQRADMLLNRYYHLQASSRVFGGLWRLMRPTYA